MSKNELRKRSLKNVGRALRGKELLTAVKPNGKLAKLASSPFRSEIKHLQGVLKNVDKAITALDDLEKATPQKTPEVEQVEKRPSTRSSMKRLKEKVSQQKKEAPVKDKSKNVGAEI